MKRSRWTIRLIGGLALTAGAAGGCKQPLLMDPADYQNSVVNAGVFGQVETDPGRPSEPPPVPDGPPPATPLDPTLPPRPFSLKEAIAIALEQGTTGTSALQPGTVNDQLPQFTGRGTTGTDSIRAFAVDPAIAGAEIERSLSKFDARLVSSITWNQNDNPSFSAFQQAFANGDAATFSSAVAKPLPTGGVAGITFSTVYNKLANPPANTGAILPQSYTPRLQFVLEQPLLQAFGVEVNQILPNHPGSFLIPGFRTTGVGTEGILITRLRQDQQRAQFDVYVNQMLLSVEAAYWNLYAAYFNLAAQEEGLKQALDAYTYISRRADAGIARQQQVSQTETQYHQFRGNVVAARTQVLNRERQLRGLLGLRSNAGDRLIPVDEPVIAPFRANPHDLYLEGRQYRPELLTIMQEYKAQQLNLLAQKNLRRPDLRFLGSYDVSGIGRRLDGTGTTGVFNNNAFRSLANNNFNTWQVGLRFDMPIGFRDANAIVRQAELNQKRVAAQMYDAERKLQEVIIERYRTAESSYLQIETARSARKAAENQIQADLALAAAGVVGGAGGQDAATFTLNLLSAQTNLAISTATEYQNIANYNIALAQIEYEKGTIQRYNNVSVNEGALPAHVQKKAADHFAAREAAIPLRERPDAGTLTVPVRTLATPQTPLAATLPTLPAPPQSMGTGVVNPPTPAPAAAAPNRPLLYAPPLGGEPAPAPQPFTPTPMTPAPMTPAPMTPTPTPLGNSYGPAVQGRPQLQPADAPGTFSASGTVTLPTRSRGPATPDTPPPVTMPVTSPGTPVSTPVRQ